MKTRLQVRESLKGQSTEVQEWRLLAYTVGREIARRRKGTTVHELFRSTPPPLADARHGDSYDGPIIGIMDPFATLAQSMGAAWVSGVNLYAACATLGLLGRYGGVELAGNLTALESWWIIGTALAMFLAEFIADKIPWFDSIWDAIHTFVRIPAGAVLAASAYSENGPLVQGGAALAGLALAGETHSLKAGTRALINTSPEPFTNWFASVAEDSIVVAAIFFAVTKPEIFLVVLVVAAVIGILILRFVWSGLNVLFSRVADLVRHGRREAASPDLGTKPAA